MDPFFQWDNKKAGTFFLHGDRWSASFDSMAAPYEGRFPIKIRPSYNLQLGQKTRFTDAMRKTLSKYRLEIETVMYGDESSS